MLMIAEFVNSSNQVESKKITYLFDRMPIQCMPCSGIAGFCCSVMAESTPVVFATAGRNKPTPTTVVLTSSPRFPHKYRLLSLFFSGIRQLTVIAVIQAIVSIVIHSLRVCLTNQLRIYIVHYKLDNGSKEELNVFTLIWIAFCSS
jgi:hypothetical protein